MKEHDESYYAFKPVSDNPIILDFTGCRYLGEIHKILKEHFGFPEYYGENWSALWDCLDGIFDGLTIVEIYGYHSMPESLKNECPIMFKIFNRVHESTPDVIFRLIS